MQGVRFVGWQHHVSSVYKLPVCVCMCALKKGREREREEEEEQQGWIIESCGILACFQAVVSKQRSSK